MKMKEGKKKIKRRGEINGFRLPKKIALGQFLRKKEVSKINRTKFFLVAISVVFVLTTMIFLENPASMGAENCLPVKVWDRGQIEPQNLSVNTGDCVVWVNVSLPRSESAGDLSRPSSSDVLLSFPNATDCVLDAVNVSTGFKMDKGTNCFVAGFLKPGETASLVFKKPGMYKYNISFGESFLGKAEGTIIVK